MTIFQNRVAESVRAGRAAADTAYAQWASDEEPNPAVLFDYEPEDVGYTDTEILLQITGSKTLHDPEEEDTIIGTFKDNFYEALEELNDE